MRQTYFNMKLNRNLRVLTTVVLLTLVGHFLAGGCGPSGNWRNNKVAFVKVTDSVADEKGGTATFEIRLGEPSKNVVTVLFSLYGSASSGVDYEGVTESVSFNPGESIAQITIAPIDDTVVEPDETIEIELNSISGDDKFSVSEDTGTITIESDDIPTVTLSATVDTTTEGSSSPAVFTVSLDDPTEEITIYYEISGDASAGVDYETLSGQAIIPARTISKTIEIKTVDNVAVEQLETVILTLKPDSAYIIGTAEPVAVSILDDDAPIATISATAPDAVEGGSSGEFTINLSYESTVDISVNITLNGSAVEDQDFSVISRTIVIPANEFSQTVSVDPIADGRIEGNETVEATIILPENQEYVVGVENTATVIIESSEKPTATVVASSSTIEEATESSTEFTISIDEALETPLDIFYTAGGSATPEADYDDSELTGTVTIPAAETSAKIKTSATLDSNDSEGDETIEFTLSDGAEYDLGTPSNTIVTITDYKLPVATLDQDPSIAIEGPTPVPGSFTVLLSIAPIKDLTILYEVADQTTADPGSDFVEPSGELVIAAGTSSGTIALTPIDDEEADDGEIVVIQLLDPADGTYKLGLDNITGKVVIQDDD